MTGKICPKCGYKKFEDLFGKDCSSIDGLFLWCKSCKAVSNKKWRDANEKRIAEYRKNNGCYHREYNKKYYKENKAYFDKHNKEYYANNTEYFREYERKKLVEDVNFLLAKGLRIRINHALKNGQKRGSAVRDLGCSVEELKIWLEQQFYFRLKTGEKMSWDNYGYYGWHIDHIKALANFDLTNRKQFKKACHWFNLQPLWAEENWSKGAKML